MSGLIYDGHRVMNVEWLRSVSEAAAALAKGQVIQRRSTPNHCVNHEWVDGIAPNNERANFSTDFDYRVKPNPPEKKWRPYYPSELLSLVGKVLKRKDRPATHVVVGCGDSCVSLGVHWTYYPQGLLDEWTHLDGTPCGVYE